MKKVTPKVDEAGIIIGYVFHCPGCEHGHIFYTKSWATENGPTPKWDFNGDLEKPTFSPSLLNVCEKHHDPKQRRCHLCVTDGAIVFCNDCTHDYASLTVVLPDRP